MTAVFPLDTGAESSVRRAALALYAVDREDRDWVLTQLTGGDRSQLEQMLHELAALGLPRDPAMVRSALGESKPARDANRAAVSVDLDRLDEAGVSALVALLEHEPASLAACVAARLAPPGRVALLEAMSAPQRRLAQAVMEQSGAQCGARLVQAVLEEVAARLPAPSRQRPLWRRWLAAWVSRGARS